MLSRRGFLAGAAALAPAGAAAGPQLAYVGTYSNPQGPEGSRGRGTGICLFEMNPASGVLTRREVFENGFNPACLVFDPSHTHLYSANETRTFEGAESGSVSAYAIDRSTGRLTALNAVTSGGPGPAHLSMHPEGKHVLVANYAGGSIAVLPILENGGLGKPTDLKQAQGKPDSNAHSANAPAGSFAWSGHDRPHAHMIQADPAGRFVLSSDLGLDRIFVWRFDAGTGTLTPNDPPYVSFPVGDGPRHFCFHPNGRWLYSIQEEASTLVTFDYDGANGRLTERQTISTLPKGFVGTNYTSAVLVSSDGRFVYGANRLHDTIAWFAVGPTGTLTLAGEESTRGDYPRTFNFDPSGNFLYSCNQRGDAITCFRVNRKTGVLTFTGQYTAVGTPAFILFLT
jgi:6-phosphogluconolactonase (cycloisomerase 2 family)